MAFVISTTAKPITSCNTQAARVLSLNYGKYLDDLEVRQIRKLLALISMSQLISWNEAWASFEFEDTRLPATLQTNSWMRVLAKGGIEGKQKLCLAISEILVNSKLAPDLSFAQKEECLRFITKSKPYQLETLQMVAESSRLFGSDLAKGEQPTESQQEILTGYCDYLQKLYGEQPPN